MCVHIQLHLQEQNIPKVIRQILNRSLVTRQLYTVHVQWNLVNSVEQLRTVEPCQQCGTALDSGTLLTMWNSFGQWNLVTMWNSFDGILQTENSSEHAGHQPLYQYCNIYVIVYVCVYTLHFSTVHAACIDLLLPRIIHVYLQYQGLEARDGNRSRIAGITVFTFHSTTTLHKLSTSQTVCYQRLLSSS